MSFKQKYLNPIILYLLVYIFGFVLLPTGTMLARYAYAYMNYLFPKLFPLFNAITQREMYDKYLMLIDVVGIFSAILIINYFALRMDNAKFEYMIRKTAGEYTLKEGLSIHIKDFGISEIITSVVLPIILVVPVYFIPNFGIQKIPVVNFLIFILEQTLWLGYAFKEYFSLPKAILLIAIASLITRAAVTPGALKRWRASWLSGAID